jgi:hypothetical protein
MSKKNCQIHSVASIAEPLGITDILRQRYNRLKRILKRRWRYITNIFSLFVDSKRRLSSNLVTNPSSRTLQEGDFVQVRSQEEIQATLDNWNQLKGCGFMENMLPYCNTIQRVRKRIENFIDERDYMVKKAKGIVILDGVFCEGNKDLGYCNRTCFFFWREEWLEKVKDTSPNTKTK